MSHEEKKYNGFCGEHCPWWRYHNASMAVLQDYSREQCFFGAKTVNVKGGDICIIPPAGSWQQMEIAPVDGRWVMLRGRDEFSPRIYDVKGKYIANEGAWDAEGGHRFFPLLWAKLNDMEG